MSEKAEKKPMYQPSVERLSDDTKKVIRAEHANDADKLKTLIVPTDDSESHFIEVAALIPNRRVLSQHMKYLDTNPAKAQDILVNSCVLTSKDRIKADDFMYNTTVALLAELIPIGQGLIKNF